MRLVYAGAAAFACVPLARLIAEDHVDVVGIYSQPPRPAGRGRTPRPSAVAELAKTHNLPLFTPQALDDDAMDAFAALQADLLVVCAYGLLLPKVWLDLPQLGAVNLHASLLPRWRGAAPIQRAIAAGDRETGVTLMRMTPELDAGPMLAARPTPIEAADTTGSLSEKLAELAADVLIENLPALEAGGLDETPQNPAKVTYASKLTRAEGRIDWQQPAETLARRVRAFEPWPGQYAMFNDQSIRIRQASTLNETSNALPGTITRAEPEHLAVACGNGQLLLQVLQRAGRRALPADEFLRGLPLIPGDRLG